MIHDMKLVVLPPQNHRPLRQLYTTAVARISLASRCKMYLQLYTSYEDYIHPSKDRLSFCWLTHGKTLTWQGATSLYTVVISEISKKKYAQNTKYSSIECSKHVSTL